MGLDDLRSTILPIVLRNGKDHRIDDGRRLKHAKGVDEKGESSEQAKLFTDGSPKAEAQTRGGDEDDGAKSLRCHARRAGLG
jgi:hypothetical protein